MESQGSCTVIASDKTGTLTVNQQTARFGDYWHLGLPLSVGIAMVALPLILFFRPL